MIYDLWQRVGVVDVDKALREEFDMSGLKDSFEKWAIKYDMYVQYYV